MSTIKMSSTKTNTYIHTLRNFNMELKTLIISPQTDKNLKLTGS